MRLPPPFLPLTAQMSVPVCCVETNYYFLFRWSLAWGVGGRSPKNKTSKPHKT